MIEWLENASTILFYGCGCLFLLLITIGLLILGIYGIKELIEDLFL